MSKQRAVYFKGGKLLIKEGEFIPTEEEAIKIILQNINLFIQNNPDVLGVKSIITSVIMDYFDADKVIVSANDSLYDYFTKFISTNDIYRDRINNCRKRCNEKSAVIREKRREIWLIDGYFSDKTKRDLRKRKNYSEVV